MKILVLTYKIPFGSFDGGEFAQRNFLLGLLQYSDHKIDLLSMNTNYDRNSKFILPSDFKTINNFNYHPVDLKINRLKAIAQLFNKKSYIVSRYYNKNFEHTLVEWLQKYTYDIIHLDHVFLSQYIPLIKKYSKAKIILRTQNIEYDLKYTIIQNIKNPIHKFYLSLEVKKLKKFETKAFLDVDGIINLTKKDQSIIINNISKEIKTTVIPIGISFSNNELKINHLSNSTYKFYFIGSFDWMPNLLSINWFLKEVWSKLNNDKIEFHIAGKKIPNSLAKKKIPNVFFYSDIKNVQTFIQDKHALIAPMICGGGQKVKIIEALSLGKPVITSSNGLCGYSSQKNIIEVADSVNGYMHLIANFANNRIVLKPSNLTEFLSDYSLEKVTIQTMKFYQKILNNSNFTDIQPLKAALKL